MSSGTRRGLVPALRDGAVNNGRSVVLREEATPSLPYSGQIPPVHNERTEKQDEEIAVQIRGMEAQANKTAYAIRANTAIHAYAMAQSAYGGDFAEELRDQERGTWHQEVVESIIDRHLPELVEGNAAIARAGEDGLIAEVRRPVYQPPLPPKKRRWFG